MTLFSELQRRNVLRMAVLYVVAAWLVLQVADVLIPLIGLPQSSGRVVLTILVIGLPISLLFAWFYELTPDGLMREKDVDPTASITHATGRRLDFVVIALLTAAIIVFAYDKWWIRTPPTEYDSNSIAVLPFVNMSNDPDQEYFSDGLAEELLNQMTQIRELRVVSRTSSFSFKGDNIGIATIAKQLNVRHILEGSVRVVGDRARISAKLIDASSDQNLWSQTFDRHLVDIFAIQDEIAAQVVDALEITLLSGVPSVRKTSPHAYALYLQAKYLGDKMTATNLQKSVDLYREALAIDPTYVPAWSGLAWRLANQANSGLLPGEGYEPARQAALKALEIDPNYGPGHGRLGWIALFHDGDLAAAARHYDRAIALDPNDMLSLGGAATMLQNLGRLEEAVAAKKHVSDRDPVYAAGHANLGIVHLYANQLDEASASFRTALTLSPNYIGAQCLLGMTMLLSDDPQSALPVVRQETFEPYRLICLALVHHALNNSMESDEALKKLVDKHAGGWAYNIAYVFAYRGETDAAFEWLARAVEYKDGGLADIAVQPLFANIQSDPRWPAFLKKLGKSRDQLAAIEFSLSLPRE